MRVRFYATKKRFADLDIKQFFYTGEEMKPTGVFMKIQSVELCNASVELCNAGVPYTANCVDLQTGALYDMSDDFQVVPCEGHIEVVLETK